MIALEKQLAPRKIPQQQRAQFTVDCILSAAESIINKSGYDAATTNHIAEVAGVSIGSLYQYFPSKESIAAALVESAVLKATNELRQCLIENMAKPLDESTRCIIRTILETRQKYSFVFLRLPREVPKLGRLSQEVTTEKFLYNTIRAYYQHHRQEILVEDLEVAMFVAEHIVVGSIDAYIENRSPILNDEQIVEQISDAVVKYLTK